MLQALRLKQERQSAFGEVESSFSVSIQPLDAYNCRWKQKKTHPWFSNPWENSSSVSSRKGLRVNPPAGLNTAAARGTPAYCWAIFSNADLTLVGSVTSALIPRACPPLELISCTRGSKLAGFRLSTTTEYALAKRLAMEAPCSC